MVRVGEGANVAHFRSVEEREIGNTTIAHAAAIKQSESLCRHAGHLVNGLLQCEHTFIAYVMPKHTREGAVVARMRYAVTQLGESPITRNHCLRMCHDALHVGFIDYVIDHPRAAIEHAFKNERDGAFRRRWHAASDGPIVQRLALQ